MSDNTPEELNEDELGQVTGGAGGKGGDVTVTNNISIGTNGIGSHGIFAQSVGGGGGNGGFSITATGSGAGVGSGSIGVSVGGNGSAGGVAIANSEQQIDLGPKFTMLKMFAQYHDLTEQQQELMTEVVIAGKKLATEVKKPKADAKAYLLNTIEQDTLNVDEILTAYYQWQQGVNVEFEQTVRAAANLHANLSVEQRKDIIESLKQMSKRH